MAPSERPTQSAVHPAPSTPGAPASQTLFDTFEFGRSGTLQHRILFLDSNRQEASPWHDVPLSIGHCHFQFICTTPAGEWVEYGPAAGEPFTPLKAKKQNGRPAHFAEDCHGFNFGFLPQTSQELQSTSGFAIDKTGTESDPLEALDIGVQRTERGDVYTVKLLGAFAVVTSRQTVSWKLLTISVADEDADLINGVDDVKTLFPGLLEQLGDWLRTSESNFEEDGNEGILGNAGEPVGLKKALQLVSSAHASWQHLIEAQPPQTAITGPPMQRPLSRTEYESMWSQHTQRDADVQIPLSEKMSHLGSAMQLDRAWADVSTASHWETNHRSAASVCPIGKSSSQRHPSSFLHYPNPSPGSAGHKSPAKKMMKFFQNMSKLVRHGRRTESGSDSQMPYGPAPLPAWRRSFTFSEGQTAGKHVEDLDDEVTSPSKPHADGMGDKNFRRCVTLGSQISSSTDMGLIDSAPLDTTECGKPAHYGYLGQEDSLQSEFRTAEPSLSMMANITRTQSIEKDNLEPSQGNYSLNIESSARSMRRRSTGNVGNLGPLPLFPRSGPMSPAVFSLAPEDGVSTDTPQRRTRRSRPKDASKCTPGYMKSSISMEEVIFSTPRGSRPSSSDDLRYIEVEDFHHCSSTPTAAHKLEDDSYLTDEVTTAPTPRRSSSVRYSLQELKSSPDDSSWQPGLYKSQNLSEPLSQWARPSGRSSCTATVTLTLGLAERLRAQANEEGAGSKS